MRISLLFFLFIILLTIASCTQCTDCEYTYVVPSSSDTITGSEQFCGSNKLVKDWEEYYEDQIQTQAFFVGTTAQVNCTRSRKQ
ncbi:MAG: hypothetical protein H7Y00_07245 [Fimbriimonadaceae bacterium]|nr:hypothetical protein [Chitinophagales bacterium]